MSLDWDELIEEQKIEVEEEFINNKSADKFKKIIENSLSNLNDEKLDYFNEQALYFINDYWSLQLSQYILESYNLNCSHWFKIQDKITLTNKIDTVCILNIGSSVTLNIYKKFPIGSEDDILHRSIPLPTGSIVKLTDTAIDEYSYHIINKSNLFYLLFYY